MAKWHPAADDSSEAVFPTFQLHLQPLKVSTELVGRLLTLP